MADDDKQVSQDEIEELLRAAREGNLPGAESAKPAAPAAGQPAAPPPNVSASAAPPAEEAGMLSQADIDALLGAQKRPAAAKKTAGPQPARPAAPPAGAHDSPIPQADIELLLSHAERALASVAEPNHVDLPEGATTFRFEDFTGAPASTEAATIELGRTHMYLEDVLKLRRGSVVSLDKLAGDPVDIYVNGRLIARGEVLVLNDNFCVRVAELIQSEQAAAG